MQKTSKLLWSGIAGIAAIMCAGAVNAASRSTLGNADAGRAATTSARMPTMPTMSINTIGTHAVSGVGSPSSGGSTIPSGGGVIPTPNPDPDPTPTSDCDDGGVRNSEFTVDMCMQSVLTCVQSGVLPHGLNDLFNEDLRHSIFNGMGICASEVDRCIREVRVDCQNVYSNAQDVWLDFNSRIVQPEYYNFVLRKTGLTPNQAENVCELLDKNTYGKSFAAVSANGNVTGEYSQTVGAYNGQENNSLSKPWPQGSTVNDTGNGNTGGVDGERGHYARWDATEGVCKIRVAAYNKDDLITNKWLFGALGDDRAAEVWQDAGSTFTCNKDLFDFSLLNKTSTVAVVGIGSGTALGALGGAIAGHGAEAFDCNDKGMREELYEQIIKQDTQTFNKYVQLPMLKQMFDKAACDKVVNLYERYTKLTSAVGACQGSKICNVVYKGGDGANVEYVVDTCGKARGLVINTADKTVTIDNKTSNAPLSAQALKDLQNCKTICEGKGDEVQINTICSFKSLKDERFVHDSNVTCSGDTGCISDREAQAELNEVRGVLDNLPILRGQKSNVLKTTLVGAGIGAAAGGVATAITAFVERNNISCRVGDGLNTVGFGKSYTIGSLKDFYVKWNLRVADSVRPTERVMTCSQWRNVCAMYTTPMECQNVELYYQPSNRSTTTLIRAACVMNDSGNCVENEPVLRSYGVTPCATNNGGGTGPIGPDIPPIGPFDPHINQEIEVIQH